MGPDLCFTKVNSLENGYKEAESKGMDDSNIPDTMSWLGQSIGERRPQRAGDQGWAEQRERKDSQGMDRLSLGDISQPPPHRWYQ